MPGKLVLDVGRRPHGPLYRPEHPHNTAAGFPQSESQAEAAVSYNLALEVRHSEFCSILLVSQANPLLCGRGLHRGGENTVFCHV